MHRRVFLQAAATAAVLGSLDFPGFALAAGSGPEDELIEAWTGEHGGYPAFDKANPTSIKAALDKGMELNKAEIAEIVGNAETPTFANTIAALEDSGRALDRAGRFFYIFTSTMNDKAMQDLQTEMSPILSAFGDDIVQNARLFARIKAVYDDRATASLSPEQNRLVENYYQNFTRQGAALNDADQARLKDLNQKLASLYTKFSQNVLADEESYTLSIETEADLDGLPESLREAAAAAAAARGMKGAWVFTNTRSSMEPFLTYSTKRALREKAWRMWIMRGDNGTATDNKAVISEILQLRAERALLLGFKSHADWAVENNMAKTPHAAIDLMMKLWDPAVRRAKEEIADMQMIADKEDAGIKIEAWDHRFYSEKVRKSTYDLDQNEVKPYLQLDKVRDGMFWVAGKLYGLRFAELEGLPVYHEDVSVYEVTRDGKRVGLWYFDPYARAGKNSGAWMNEYRTQERFKGDVTPIVSNNANFVKSGAGPVLISWDDATTMFHEFGHALHGLNSNVTYPSVAGTSVKRDFVEFPSQINEHWFPTPELLNQFALHVDTGKPIPADLLAKIQKSLKFNQGFKTVEYLASAIYDMKIHLAATPGGTIDPDAFEKSCMAEIGLPREIVMRHRPTQFGHTFSSDGYSAGYYVYLWADALTADAWELFEERGVWDPATAKAFLDDILSVGNAVAPDEAFREFRGRDVDTEALMRLRGFA
ncbi:M3 family metallopeptidase [Actinoplanes aureus]|uniref:M3 family metallopeptidase n=1 Tax=Actinoplanes aureus TaxID=2792083 RepID=A0A931CFM5_9ACTN|nr:M3 family metallopeptidase [Actinoplanes aureus]MBG0566662.1 M3 family metallopeptidase [Actinoplanes aureus]